jgi:hypothetical protein
MVTVYMFEQIKLFNITKQQVGVLKIQKHMTCFHNLTP